MKKSILTIVAMAALPCFVFAQEDPLQHQSMRLTSNYVVRNLNGDQVCNLEKGAVVAVVGIAPDGQRVKIMAVSGPCAGVTNGFAYVNYLRPVSNNVDKYTETAVVEISGLSLRKEPSVEDGTLTCSLPANTKLNIINENQKRNRWVEVEVVNPPSGCPAKGWVAASYLKPDFDLKSLPKIQSKDLTEARTPRDCTDCDQNETSGGKISQIKRTATTAQEIERFVNNPQVPGEAGPFVEFAKELQSKKKCPPAKESDYKCNRGLMEMPAEGNAGFCGTHHYSADKPPGIDAYTAPHTACSLAGLAQDWKKTACPSDNAGCKIAWGDISHKNRPYFNSHKEHTNGECIDIRPFNKGAFRDSGRTVSTPDYDRDTTVAFLRMAKKYGGDIMYSDRKLMNANKDLKISWGGSAHNNHMHICFGASNPTVKESCNNLKVDPNVCSELQ